MHRRHLSLLRSLASDGRTLIPVHTILELYRVSDMSLVSVMPSAEDEVNAAAFSPLPVCSCSAHGCDSHLGIVGLVCNCVLT